MSEPEINKNRFAFIGTPNMGKISFLPYLTGEREINPPIAQAMQKCGYISKETEKKLTETYHKRHLAKVMKELGIDE